MTKRTAKPFQSLYSEEEKAYFIETLIKSLNRKGKPSYADALREIEATRPGVLQAQGDKNKKIFLIGLWKKRGPNAVMKQKVEDRVVAINEEIKREDLVGMIKLKAREFMMTDYDDLKPSDKLKLVSEAIKADYNEEKLQIEKDKLRANKRMMDSLMGSLMSGDKAAILSKYEVSLAQPQNLIQIPIEESNE